MGFEQDTLIYIEDQEKLDASAAANAFAHKDVKNRAYINTLGAELALKYLASEGVKVNDIYNIHSIKKILEELDISDIMLPNIHIDVRMIFDENVIFIPKSHFEYNLVPDIYLVFNLAKDFSYVKFLGFFEPKLINKNNANSDYYFIEKEKLTPPYNLKQYIENFKGNTKEQLSENDISDSERIIMAMADNDISEDEKKYLIKQLTKSAELRDKFIEYENFETLSYKAMTDPEIHKKEIITQTDKSTVETVQEQAIENSDITDDNFIEPLEKNEISESDILANISDTSENTLNSLDQPSDIVNNDIELPADLTSNDFSSPEPLVLDAIDTSELDNIQIPEEKFEEETISFDNIDVPETTEHTDFIDKIDNKISFNDIPEQSESAESEITLNSDETIVSFDDIDISHLENLSEEQNYDKSFVSLDNIDTSTDDLSQTDLGMDEPEEKLSIENIHEENLLNNSITNMEEQNIQLEDINVSELTDPDINNNFDSETIVNSPLEDSQVIETEQLNLEDETTDTQIPDNTSFDEISTSIPEENDNNSDDIINDFLEESSISLDDIVAETHDSQKNEGFGNNLLENLSADSIDDISIESLGINNDNTITDTSDISSDDLLSQADELLGTSQTIENNDDIKDENLNTFFEDIPQIDDITSTENTNVNATDTSDTLPETSLDDITENINNSITQDDDNSEISIDDLLNMSDNAAFANNITSDIQTDDMSDDKLGVLFNDTDPVTDAELDNMEEFNQSAQNEEIEQQIPGSALFNKPAAKSGKKAILVAAAVVTVIAAASAFVFLKPKNGENENIATTDSTAPAEILNTPEQSTKQNNNEEILANNVPDISSKNTPKQIQKTPVNKELKNNAVNKKPVSSESYLTVNRLVWDIPDSLSYSKKMQNYLRAAGKSIKLTLSADLLLAKEYAYTNQVKVSLKLSKTGNVQEASIVSSSGSDEIDKIVLQSVKDTLNVVKPPSEDITTPDFNLNLIIYF